MESPILALVALPLVVAIVMFARRVPARASRWLIRAAAFFLLGGIAGVNVQCDRPLNIAVLVDVSPSTRGATFRDPKSVTARLTPLLSGHPYTLHYFGDGLQTSADELPIERTRLEAPPDADAIVLMSDGRFDAPADLPPVYAVVDPALDQPGDGRVDVVSIDNEAVTVRTTIAQLPRALRLHGTVMKAAPLLVGTPLVRTTVEAKAQSVTAQIDGGDRWPENDGMTISTLPGVPTQRWAIGMAVPGFVSLAPLKCPTELSKYLDTASIVLSTDAALSNVSTERLKQYVDDLGGTLICVGSANALPPALRAIAPLTSEPPTPTSNWTVLLDASGSMGTDDVAGRSRWSYALAAADRAIEQLPANARVTVMTFARSVKTIAEHATPSGAREALKQLADIAPSGPTGLRTALDAIAHMSNGRSDHVLLLTDADADLGDVNALSKQLMATHVALFALTTTESQPIATLAGATGGRQIVRDAPADWSAAMQALATSAGTPTMISGAIAIPCVGTMAGTILHIRDRWPAWARRGADVLADVAGDPIVAAWQSASGSVVSVSARLSPEDLETISSKFEKPATDPRFATTWNPTQERVQIVANDSAGPMNGLHFVLRRGESDTMFEQVAPGRYEAPLPRERSASIAVVRFGGHVIARRAVDGRYAHEFDAIGNDRPALQALADRTSGAVIEAGDTSPIVFAKRTTAFALTTACSLIAFVLLIAAIVVVRK